LKSINQKLESLLDRVKQKDVTICVLGLGRVGLPLSTVFANVGIKIIGVDIDQKKNNLIKNSKSPFFDHALQLSLEKAIKSGNLIVESSLKFVKNPIDVIILTVGTPNTANNEVDYSQLYSVLDELCKIDINGKMIILRSTVPPKTTTDIVLPFLENETSLKSGKDFGLAMCPERILEGQAIREINELPEIIGGVNNISNDIAASVFRIINSKKEMLFTSPSGAELAKLFANIYRYISFALSNEFAIWAEKYGLDAAELIRISNHNYDRCNIPIPGFVGGPCLSKDGIFLDSNTTFTSIVSTAWKLNESIPRHIVNIIKNSMGSIFNKKIAVLGIAFKAGSDDTRQSPSIKLVELLKSFHANVLVHDPHIKETSSLSEVLDSPDVVIIATNHEEFKDIIPQIRKSKCKLIYDVWSMFNDNDFPDQTYVRFGQG